MSLEDKYPVDTAIIEALVAEIGPESVARVLEVIAGDADRLLAGLGNALATDNPKAFTLYAHSLKSNALTVGAAKVGALFQELETLGNQRVLTGLESTVKQAQAQYRRLVEFIVTAPDSDLPIKMSSVG